MTYASMRQALVEARARGIELPDFSVGSKPGANRSFHYTDCSEPRRHTQVDNIDDQTWWKGECLTCFDASPPHVSAALEMVRTATYYGKEVLGLTESMTWVELHKSSTGYGNEYEDAMYEWRDFCADYREHTAHDGLSILQRKDMMKLEDDSTPLAHYGHELAATATTTARAAIAATPLRTFLIPTGRPPRPVLYAAGLHTKLPLAGRSIHAQLEDITLLAEAKHRARTGDMVLVDWDLSLHKWTDARGLAATGDYTQVELETALQVYAAADETLTLQDALDAVHVASTA